MTICRKLSVEIAEEKTVMASETVTFLGMMLNGKQLVITVPEEKKCKALNWLNYMISKRTVRVKEMERRAGLLNFINKAVVPGRTFTRRMYAKFTKTRDQKDLKSYHHMNVDTEFKQDCMMWIQFLKSAETSSIARPYWDIETPLSTATRINFTSDASASEILGFGSFYDGRWLYSRWEKGFISKVKPSIGFLKLYALCMGIFYLDR